MKKFNRSNAIFDSIPTLQRSIKNKRSFAKLAIQKGKTKAIALILHLYEIGLKKLG
ncbi:MAG: hypothetical protein IPJ74_14050 [Saprospiraceae bacterium]|nr:hypothetical protein [Saprospiraceae bacterium]